MSPDGVRVAFQLDRFEQTGEDRLEVAGRWFGVRGLRFVRPALTVQTKDGERNLLALLEHKPWAAEEGEAWVAAFPWKGDSPDPGQTELAVAPSVVVMLADEKEHAGGAAAPRGRGSGRRNLSERLEESEKRARRLASEVAWLREEREALLTDKGTAADDATTIQAELVDARASGEAMQRERDASLAERDLALGERDKAAAERQAAFRERDSARSERDELQRERDGALAARTSALAKLEEALRERSEAMRERDRALSEHGAIAADRDEAIEARRRALAERDAALGRGSGFPAVSAADLARQPHSPVGGGSPARTGPRLPAMSRADPMARAIAAGALVVLLLVVLLLLKVA